MTQADYQLAVYTPYSDEVDVVPMSRLLSLSYERKVNDVGTLEFTLDGTDRLVPILMSNESLDYIIDVYRRNTPDGSFEIEGSYFLRGADIFEVEETLRENLICSCDALETLLESRIIIPDDDPVEAGGFITRSGSGDEVMMDLVNFQCIAPVINSERRIPNFTEATFTADYNLTFQRRSGSDKLWDTLLDIAKQSFVDFWITHEGSDLVFHAGRVGTDRSQSHNYPSFDFVLLTPPRGNLRSPRLRWDRRKEITFMFVAAQGVGEHRVYIGVGSGRTYDSPYNRREAITDARTDESFDELVAQGNAELFQNQPVQEFSFIVNPTAGGGRYNIDWFLGDVITATYKNFTADFRVIGVKIDVDKGGETITPELKTPPFGG